MVVCTQELVHEEKLACDVGQVDALDETVDDKQRASIESPPDALQSAGHQMLPENINL